MKYERPRVSISKCLGFEKCRFDGSMISSDEVDQLKEFVDFLPLCPEMGMGLPSPRESLRLIIDKKNEDNHRLSTTKSGIDMTEEMLEYSKQAYIQLIGFDPDGFLLKSRSPSCGIKEVRLYSSIEKGPSLNNKSKGLYAEYMMEKFPELIFEDEGRISNFNLREHFYTAIFTKADFRKTKELRTIKALIDFHSKNKYLFMTYSQNQLSVLGKIVANHEKKTIDDTIAEYESNMNKLLLKMPATGRYINVMLHIFGYFSKRLLDTEKAYFLDSLENYRSQHIPQSTVMGLLWSWVIRFDEAYLKQQTVFNPFPKKLIQVTDSGKGL
jgi:uncharacterized protein YbgA (DUF1722 family)/uncharacterized protein YbbK (DUF523 family)